MRSSILVKNLSSLANEECGRRGEAAGYACAGRIFTHRFLVARNGHQIAIAAERKRAGIANVGHEDTSDASPDE